MTTNQSHIFWDLTCQTISWPQLFHGITTPQIRPLLSIVRTVNFKSDDKCCQQKLNRKWGCLSLIVWNPKMCAVMCQMNFLVHYLYQINWMLVAANFSLRDDSWQNEQQIYCNVTHWVQQMSESDVNNNFNIVFKFGGENRGHGVCVDYGKKTTGFCILRQHLKHLV